MQFRVILLGLILQSGMLSAADKVIRTATVGELLGVVEQSVPATAVTYQQSTLSAQLSGQLIDIPHPVGTSVRKGDTVAEIDCSDHRLQVDAANATVESIVAQTNLGRSQLKRITELQSRGNASIELLDQRRTELSALSAQLKGARAQQQLAKLNASRCQIKAPFDSVISDRLAATGDLLSPGTPVISLTGTSDIELQAQLTPPQLDNLKQASSLTFIAYGTRYPARFRTAVPFVSSTTRTQDVRFDFNSDTPLPGAAGRLNWTSKKQYLPARYLVKRNQQNGIMLFRDGKAVFHPLADAIEGQAIKTDLPADALLITDGRFSVTDGEPVQREP